MSQITVGLITGSGTYAIERLDNPQLLAVDTEFGFAEVTSGRLAGTDVLHVSRHGDGHVRLSHQVNHRANIAALAQLGADCVVGMTICGAVDPQLRLGDMIVFDDLYFPSNRLPDGSACTMFSEPGDPLRAHWIFEQPFSDELGNQLVAAGSGIGRRLHACGCYGHVDGPRFNTVAEVRALHNVGVTAISQTGGPETVLCGEAQLPYALAGYVTDWANGAGPKATPVSELLSNMVTSVGAFDAVIERFLEGIADATAPGVMYGFEHDRHLFTSGERNSQASTAKLSVSRPSHQGDPS